MKKLYVVGMGPGDHDSMTIRADRVLRECDVIVGYTVYVELAEQYYPEKEFLTTPMRRETERCRLAFSEASKGRTTAMICSGDAGVYGMAGLILEIGREYPEVSVEIVPGVTAASSGAAVLGAPLMHDFAVISLSDLLTPWETTKALRRGHGETSVSAFIIPPAKTGRLPAAGCEILMEEKSPDTVCGSENIGREGEESQVMTLGSSGYETDMFTTVFVKQPTMELSGAIVTPRYRL
ncbi:MAG: precorrin-3B C(17)-methyltransferase [Enterocloster sp.]